ncbi:MAG: hypothetical protein JJ960_12565 [Kordiimonadaceae bacterium]|nr:hypothetical protein [Kordiimonadaceae bacterium]MBO6569579.1 hypothetical protein [Kordiimonadaceae bacterium]
MTQGSNRANFAIYADGKQLPVQHVARETWCHGQLLELYECALDAGARHILVDKRQMITPWDSIVCKSSVEAVGRTLNRHRARLAVVIDKSDHIEKAACLGIMQHGGKVLSTYDMEEAQSWLVGDIF